MSRLATFVLALATACVTPHLAIADWMIPVGLNPGDKFRVAFVTSTRTFATSPDIDYYNTFVNDAANVNGGLSSQINSLTGGSVSWKAIASTAQADAIDNIQVATDAMIYNTQGNLISTSMFLMFAPVGAGLLSPINFDESGATGNFTVWTGTTFDGRAGASIGLGSTRGTASIGQSDRSDRAWIHESLTTFEYRHHLYGISSELTVPTAVPEPSSLAIFASLPVMFGLKRRFRRQSPV